MVITCSDTARLRPIPVVRLDPKALEGERAHDRGLSSSRMSRLEIGARITEGVANDSVRAIIINGGTESGGTPRSKPWMRCWKNDWMDSAKSFGF